MNHQHFQAPVGQVAGGHIYNHARWDPLSSDELKKLSRNYKSQRLKAVLSEWFNIYSFVILLLCIALGSWGAYQLQVGGLTGEIPPFKWMVLFFFAAAIGITGWRLSILRAEAKSTIAEIDSDLKEINSLLRFRKSKR